MYPIEELLQIDVHHPPVPLSYVLLRRSDCRVTASSGPEAMAPVVEGRFVVWTEHSVRGLLYDSVHHVRYAKASLATARFWYPDSANSPRSVPSRQQLASQLRQDLVEML